MSGARIDKLRPERRAGGFPRDDGTIEFYTRVRALLGESAAVLDLGAGRGALAEDPVPLRTELATLKGGSRHVIGADIDPAVLSNPLVDESVVLSAGSPLPFAKDQFDLIVCDWVLEHIEHPQSFADDIFRVLKPGGWFCARTPNKFGYLALSASLVGRRFEDRVLSWAQPNRESFDVFPKHYRLNTISSLRSAFPPGRFEDCSYYFNPEPGYARNNGVIYRIIEIYQKMAPRQMSTCVFVFFQRLPHHVKL